jgi:hypothetical protein
MRAVLVCVLVVGCGKVATPPDEGKAPTPPSAKPSGPPVDYKGEYQEGNPIAADLKYKGKLVRMRGVEIDKVARAKDGRAYAGIVMLQNVVADAEPNYFFFMSDTDAAKVRLGSRYDITGECRGHERDNFWRGGVAGWDWHVDFIDCTVSPSTVPLKK